jgi:hypothetical protein
MLVTLSARKDSYERTKPELDSMVDSLLVYQL